ncbi:MAG: PQQ-binding-like beta-propeller repeat protein [Candidatus Bathyarchaeota archaeon]|nr:PQQ-binding-like beta-propeller repeat protein [Candidatus Termiticorpusculum sp.]
MKILKNKKILSTIAILMVLSFVATMIALPITNAQGTDRITYPFIDAVPMTAGVGQFVLINFGLLNQLYGVNDGWNMTLIITDPDGITSKIDLMTWSTGSAGYGYTPTKVGDYKVQSSFERAEYNGVWYASSESEIMILKVVEEWKPDYPGHSLPEEYWYRPIDSQLREWWSIAGSWLVNKPQNLYAPYNKAPESSHILWTMPIGDTMGGIAGGANSDIAFQSGDAYEGKFAGSIILAGVLYYNRYVSNSPTQTIVAVDLHTGKTLWERSYDYGGGRINRGQILTFSNYNNRGAWAYIWMVSGSNWFALDALTGDLKYNMTNVPSGTIYYGPSGELLIYSVTNIGTADSPNYRLMQWNSTYVVNNGTRSGTADAWGSNVQGRSYNATSLGYDLNVSLPSITSSIGNLLIAFPEDRAVFGNYSAQGVTLTGISLNSNSLGTILFHRETWQAPAEWQGLTTSGSQSGWTSFSQEDYVAILWTKENRVNYAFSLKDGKYMWQTEPQNYADAWAGATANSSPEKLIAYNRLYEAGPSGIVYCYDITNGKTLWTYEATDKYTESYIRENWWISPCFISDGKIYVGHREHSTLEPKPRGAPFIALNAYTGDVVWSIEGAFRQTMWGGRAIIGDSIIATMDTYDQQIYAIGKGPSAITVSAPDIGIAANTPVMIKGTIMDVSPGTQNDKIQLRFPNGVAAVSDASMNDWMLYVYKQFPQPMTTTGVDIRIDAVDPNNNYVTLGHTTSDANGRFALEFTPKTEGQYTIYAIFEGSASYYPATAQNEMTVMTAAINNTPRYELYIIAMGIAVIITVILIGLLILKKK